MATLVPDSFHIKKRCLATLVPGDFSLVQKQFGHIDSRYTFIILTMTGHYDPRQCFWLCHFGEKSFLILRRDLATFVPGTLLLARFCKCCVQLVAFTHNSQYIFHPNYGHIQLGHLSPSIILVPLLNMEFSNSDVKAGDVIGTVELMEEVADNMYPTSSCAQVEGEPQSLAYSVRRSKLKQQLKLPELQADLAKAGMSTDQVKEIAVLLDADDVFALDESELGQTSLVTHSINTGDHPPIKQQSRRTPFCHKEKISQLVNDVLEKKVIQPSSSAWVSPIVLVPKKDGTQHFCVDYRRVNAVTKKDVYPLSRIDDILDTLSGTKYFSTLDLCSGYWQIQLDPEKSAFTTHSGLCEFTRMPFRLYNAPATFQRLLQTVLSGLEGKFCFVYLDDILICSKSFKEHLQHLQQIFERLRKTDLTLKPKKCSFLRKQVTTGPEP